jgi:hypothetical protein
MAVTQEGTPIRGAIRTSVSTSTESLVSGQNFSIFVTIQNPFEVPLVCHSVSTHVPTEFVDIDQLQRELLVREIEEQIAELEEAGRAVNLNPTTFIPRRSNRLSGFLRGISRVSLNFAGLGVDFRSENQLAPAIARDLSSGTSIQESSVGLKFPLLGSITSTIRSDLKSETDQEEIKASWRERLEEERQKYVEALQSIQQIGSMSKTLQAGNSTTRVFTLRSKQAIWFKPASYKLHIEVEYEIAGTRNVDTIEHVLQVKSSLSSIVLGAILGGLGGWFASKGSTITFSLTDWISLSVSLVLAAMAVVLFARKKDVQPLIAVEDFWGGIAIGFLVAYSGPKVLGDIIPG